MQQATKHSNDSLLWVGFHGESIENIRWNFSPGGVIFFGRNLHSDPLIGPELCFRLIRWMVDRHASSIPLAIAIDQEGGNVSRLRPWVGPTPNFKTIYDRQGLPGCRLWGGLWGEGCRRLGFNVNFAPVADCWDGHQGTGMGDRCVSDDPRIIVEAVEAYLEGLESFGVQGCLKHFPGLGGTTIDSHQGLPEITEESTLHRNVTPFIGLSRPDRLVMVAHLKTPYSEAWPLSMHPLGVAQNIAGIKGSFLPDDLEMGGCNSWSWKERIERCLLAGHDWLLVCQTEEGIRICAETLREFPKEICQPALDRSIQFRSKLKEPDLDFDAAGFENWRLRVKNEAQKYLV